MVEITMEQTDLKAVESDLHAAKRVLDAVNHVLRESAQNVPKNHDKDEVAKYIAHYTQRLGGLLNDSVQTKYESDAGVLYAALIDRLILTHQSALCAAGKFILTGDVAQDCEFQRFQAESQRIAKTLESILYIEDTQSSVH